MSRLPASVRAQDPLLAAGHDYAARFSRDLDAAGSANRSGPTRCSPTERPIARRLREAACWMSDLGSHDHPEYRAEQAFLRALRHPGRRLRPPRPRLPRDRDRAALRGRARTHPFWPRPVCCWTSRPFIGSRKCSGPPCGWPTRCPAARSPLLRGTSLALGIRPAGARRWRKAAACSPAKACSAASTVWPSPPGWTPQRRFSVRRPRPREHDRSRYDAPNMRVGLCLIA